MKTKSKTPRRPPRKSSPRKGTSRKSCEERSDPCDRLFEAMWHGTVDGDAFDGDPADLW